MDTQTQQATRAVSRRQVRQACEVLGLAPGRLRSLQLRADGLTADRLLVDDTGRPYLVCDHHDSPVPAGHQCGTLQAASETVHFDIEG